MKNIQTQVNFQTSPTRSTSTHEFRGFRIDLLGCGVVKMSTYEIDDVNPLDVIYLSDPNSFYDDDMKNSIMAKLKASFERKGNIISNLHFEGNEIVFDAVYPACKLNSFRYNLATKESSGDVEPNVSIATVRKLKHRATVDRITQNENIQRKIRTDNVHSFAIGRMI